jgi:hypothetical protein
MRQTSQHGIPIAGLCPAEDPLRGNALSGDAGNSVVDEHASYDMMAAAASLSPSLTFHMRTRLRGAEPQEVCSMPNATTSVSRWSWAEVCARRLDRHALATPQHGARLVDIAGTMCGVHAQVLSAAELSLRLRIPGLTGLDVRDALWTEHSLVKTFGPRGTVHLLPAQDLPMWTGALSAIPPSPSPFPQDAQLTPEQTDEILAAIAVALDDAELTVDKLTEALVAACGAWAGDLVMPAFNTMWPRWRQAVDTAANRGVLCFGPNRGRKVTYTNPRRWLPGFRPADGPTAIADVLRR